MLKVNSGGLENEVKEFKFKIEEMSVLLDLWIFEVEDLGLKFCEYILENLKLKDICGNMEEKFGEVKFRV